MKTRAQTWEQLTASPLDLLVVGGGIVGAGVVRDAAMRGLKVGLVEQHDFAFGTSSRSSRLLHGGIRYLAQGRIGLVREASLEKAILHRIAPHLAQPLAFVFPTYAGSGWPLWQMRAGVKIYDLLCSGKNLGKSSALTRLETARALPQLKTERLTGAVRYYDCLTNDARLVLDTLRSASRHGGMMANYARLEGAVRHGQLWQCFIADVASAQSIKISTRAIVNAGGPWASQLPHSKVKLRLTKGIHLVLQRNRLQTADAVVMTEGKRVLFVIPWGKRLILGTTDTDYNGSLDSVHADAADKIYLLNIANEFFPQAQLNEKDILSSWAGLRPLLADGSGGASDISRAHQILNPEPGWWDVAGGKLTTHRLMAEQTLDQISAALSLQTSACRTAQEPLLPAPDQFSGILPPPFTREAVEHYCQQEWLTRLDDLMVRRTSWHYYADEPMACAQQSAVWMAELLHWSKSRQAEELAAYEKLFVIPPAA